MPVPDGGPLVTHAGDTDADDRAAWLDQFAANIRDRWINHDIDAHVAYRRGWREVAEIASVGMTLSTGAQPLERARTILKTAVVNALEALKRLEVEPLSTGTGRPSVAEECKHQSSSVKLLEIDENHDYEASEVYVWLVCNDCYASSGRVKIFANSDEDRARVWEQARQQGTIPERPVSCMACGGAGVRHFCELPNDERCSACDGRGYRNA